MVFGTVHADAPIQVDSVTETQTLKLYELSKDGRMLRDALASADEEDATDILALLDQYDSAIEVKADDCAAVLRELTLTAEAFRSEAERLTNRVMSIENAASRLKTYLKENLIAAGLSKVQGKRFSLSISPSQPSVEVVNEKAIPPEFMRPKWEPDKVGILQHWRATGTLPPGVRLNSGYTLRIR